MPVCVCANLRVCDEVDVRGYDVTRDTGGNGEGKQMVKNLSESTEEKKETSEEKDGQPMLPAISRLLGMQVDFEHTHRSSLFAYLLLPSDVGVVRPRPMPPAPLPAGRTRCRQHLCLLRSGSALTRLGTFVICRRRTRCT